VRGLEAGNEDQQAGFDVFIQPDRIALVVSSEKFGAHVRSGLPLLDLVQPVQVIIEILLRERRPLETDFRVHPAEHGVRPLDDAMAIRLRDAQHAGDDLGRKFGGDLRDCIESLRFEHLLNDPDADFADPVLESGHNTR
jgi:hypothetical protein